MFPSLPLWAQGGSMAGRASLPALAFLGASSPQDVQRPAPISLGSPCRLETASSLLPLRILQNEGAVRPRQPGQDGRERSGQGQMKEQGEGLLVRPASCLVEVLVATQGT